LRLRGINYDTGFAAFGALDQLSRPSFDPEQVRNEIAIIARDLHCTAVRISGREIERLVLAAEAATSLGLEVWFSPFPTELGPAELAPYFREAARAAEPLRARGNVVFVLGCELTVFNRGFLPGDTQLDRLHALADPALLTSAGLSIEEQVRAFHSALAESARAVRESFEGPLSYAAGSWEPVDWSLFDIIGVDHYLDASNRDSYGAQLRPYLAHGRPVVVTEFGCCTYRGAEDRGALGWNIVDRAARPQRLTQHVVRDERVQVQYLREVLRALEQEPVAGAFWFTFASYLNPHHADAHLDLDCASYGLVKVLESGTGNAYPGLPWEPKLAFHVLSELYARRE
jgi:hypothetical protein